MGLVVNPAALGLIAALRAQPGRAIPGGGPVTLREGESDFFALLGTDNGRSTARMLATYPRMFGRKVITEAVVDMYTPSICWVLKVLEPLAEPFARPKPRRGEGGEEAAKAAGW